MNNTILSWGSIEILIPGEVIPDYTLLFLSDPNMTRLYSNSKNSEEYPFVVSVFVLTLESILQFTFVEEKRPSR